MPTAGAVFTPSLPPLALSTGTPYSAKQYLDNVRAQGVQVDPRTLEVQAGYFRVAASSFLADGEQALIWLYADPAAREADSSRISPDGNQIAGQTLTWGKKPNFFIKGNLMVQFVSDNDETARKLKAALDALP